jgi:mRNA-degrading endonuclease RelE of RelBE toxin-antitoxin system
MYRIKWSSRAQKQFARLRDVRLQTRIADAVETLRDPVTARHVKPLVGHTHGYRLRIGDYRVLFDVDEVIRIVEIQEVKKRDDRTY